ATSALVQDGRLLLEMGKLDEAEAKLKEAFRRAPENKAAPYYLKLISEVRSNQEARLREVIAKERPAEVEEAWNAPAKTPLLFTRVFKVNPDSFLENLGKMLGTVPDNSGSDKSTQTNPLALVKRFLSAAGIDMRQYNTGGFAGSNKAVFYNDR